MTAALIYALAFLFGLFLYCLCDAVIGVLRKWEAATITPDAMPTEAELRERDEESAKKASTRYTNH